MKKTTKTKTAGQKKRALIMAEFDRGELRSGSKRSPVVTNVKQAIAVSYPSEARKAAQIRRKK